MPPTGRRNVWVIGDSLAIDDLGGHTYYRSELEKTFYGQLVPKELIGEEAQEHPQLRIRALRDPYPLSDPRPDAATSVAAIVFDVDLVQGVQLPLGAAQHLFKTSQMGIQEIEIAADGVSAGAAVTARSFVVR